MLTKEEQRELRSKLFRHLDGIVVAPAAYVLHKKELTDFLLEKKSATLSDLAAKFKANDGYLNVALRSLCSQGWLNQSVDNTSNTVLFEVNEKSKEAFEHFSWYKDVVELLRMSENYHPRRFEMEPFLKLESSFKSYSANSVGELSDIRQQILMHVQGIILGPTLVRLGMSGMFHKYFMETRFRAEEFHRNAEGFERLLDILSEFGWFNKANGSFEFTEEGLFFAKRASAYGVTVSYIPTLRKLDELIFGNPQVLKTSEKGETEKHVDREMNVWGSGGAHAAYFKVVDEIIIELFNRPIDEQPKGILDMGCGNGAFLQHLFTVVEHQTKRGQLLDEHPLILIGADYNEAALKVSRENLVQAEIWAKLMWGDIGNPDLLAKDLMDRYDIELSDLLNVRTFLDHNRMWSDPIKQSDLTVSSSSGSYASNGNRLDNNLVSQSLLEHFQKWSPYLQKFGLLIIELHTVPPELVAANLGKTAGTAYDATHGYSDQFIIEVQEFLEVAKAAGMNPDMEKFRRYPNSDLATVSINLFRSEN